MSHLRIAVVGVGHLGQHHARILAGLAGVELVGVADVAAEQARSVAERLGVPAFPDHRLLLDRVDAACIVVPTPLHAVIAEDFLHQRIPLLIEKPLAHDLPAAQRLVDLAQSCEVPVQVGHIERFNPAYAELRRHRLRPRYVRVERQGPFSGRSADTSVVLDLMIHDLDLLLDLVGCEVREVEASGISIFAQTPDLVQAHLRFADGCTADVVASRAHAVPSRRMEIWGAEGQAQIDFAQRRLTLIQPSQEVRRRGLDPARLDASTRNRLREDLFGVHLETLTVEGQGTDQLTAELTHFLECVRTGSTPCVDAGQGRDAIALAERIHAVLQLDGWNEPRPPLFRPHALPAAA